MNKVFKGLGVLFLVLIGASAAMLGTTYYHGRVLAGESKAYVESAIPAITTAWDKRQLVDRASPTLMGTIGPGQLDGLFTTLAQLGGLTSFETPTGGVHMFRGVGGSFESADYAANAKFANGTATLGLHLVRRDGQWQIDGFHVESMTKNDVDHA